MRTYQIGDRTPDHRITRTTAPHPWESAAWATDSRLAHWSEMERDWVGAAPFVPSAPVRSKPLPPPAEDKPITLLTLVCLVLAAVVSGTFVVSLMRVLVG